MRKTCEEIEVNVAYRWFLGISMDEQVPNYSSWSQNYIRRYKDSIEFEQIFDQIMKQAISHGFIHMNAILGGSTKSKVKVNKNKNINELVDNAKKMYEEKLLNEMHQEHTMK